MADPVTQSMVASGVLDSLVFAVFAFRLWIRISMQRVGWEDIWATVAFVCGVLNAASNWVYLIDLGAGRTSMSAMWIYMFTFSFVLWAVRISIILSVNRIIPNSERLHAHGLRIIILFLFLCSGIIIQKGIVCNHAYHAFTSASSSPYARCNLIRSMSISELAVGSVADIITVIFPMCVLRRVTLSPKHLRLLRLLFSSTIAVSFTCTLAMIFRVIPALAHWSVFVTNIQIATCLIVCNLLVVVTYLYRVLGCQKYRTPSDSSDSTDSTTVAGDDELSLTMRSQQMTLTTIDLLFPITMHSTHWGSVMTEGAGDAFVSRQP